MNDLRDFWTQTISRGIDIVFAKHPARTGLGVILGCALAFLVAIFEPTLRTLSFVNIAGAPLLGWIVIGLLIMHSPTMIYLVRRKPIGEEAVDQVIEVIERANFSQTEKRQQYRALIVKMSHQIGLSQKTIREIHAVENNFKTDDASMS